MGNRARVPSAKIREAASKPSQRTRAKRKRDFSQKGLEPSDSENNSSAKDVYDDDDYGDLRVLPLPKHPKQQRVLQESTTALNIDSRQGVTGRKKQKTSTTAADASSQPKPPNDHSTPGTVNTVTRGQFSVGAPSKSIHTTTPQLPESPSSLKPLETDYELVSTQGLVTGSTSDPSSQLRSFVSNSIFKGSSSSAPQFPSMKSYRGIDTYDLATEGRKKTSNNSPLSQTAKQSTGADTSFTRVLPSDSRKSSDSVQPFKAIEESDTEAESGCLWENIGRRRGAVQSQSHEEIYPVREVYLKALIFSGHGGNELTAWPEMTGIRFNNTMIKAWQKMARMLNKEDEARDDNGFVMPTPHEARKLYDSFSPWRSNFLYSVRKIVSCSYPWQAQKTPAATKALAERLLYRHNFICGNPLDENPHSRFTAKIVAEVIAQSFYNGGKSGIATQSYTRKLFDPLPVKVIVLAICAIGHAIMDYSHGQKATVRWDALVQEDFWKQVEASWYGMCEEKQVVVRKILTERIRRLTRHVSKPISVEPIVDKFANSLSDLPLEELIDSDSGDENDFSTREQKIQRLISEIAPSKSSEAHLFVQNTPAKPNRGRLPSLAQETQPEGSKSTTSGLMILDKELEELGDTYCLIAKQKGKENISVEAEWKWDLNRLRRELEIHDENSKLWCRISNRDTVVDDNAGYAKFLKWAASEVALDGEVTISVEALGVEEEETGY